MRRYVALCGSAGLFLAGLLLGSQGWIGPSLLQAEASPPPAAKSEKTEPVPTGGISPETREKIKAAYIALRIAADALEKEGFYRSASNEVNVFGVLSGGVDALQDLRSGNGVDPETFAAIYAQTISEDFRGLLEKDSTNRYTFEGKLVQLYPVSELRRRFIIRAQLTGQVPDRETTEAPASSPPQKQETPDAPAKTPESK